VGHLWSNEFLFYRCCPFSKKPLFGGNENEASVQSWNNYFPLKIVMEWESNEIVDLMQPSISVVKSMTIPWQKLTGENEPINAELWYEHNMENLPSWLCSQKRCSTLSMLSHSFWGLVACKCWEMFQVLQKMKIMFVTIRHFFQAAILQNCKCTMISCSLCLMSNTNHTNSFVCCCRWSLMKIQELLLAREEWKNQYTSILKQRTLCMQQGQSTTQE